MNPWSDIEQHTRDEHERFRAALEDSRRAQHDQLMTILDANCESVIGRRHRFEQITGVDDYRTRVPVHDYADLAPLVEAGSEGERGQTVSAAVLVYELTSGSSQPSKLIPYTGAALDGFQRAIHPWLHDLAVNRPALGHGRAYFAISPPARTVDRTPDGTPIGMDDDADYFGAALAAALRQLMAVPLALAGVADIDSWRYLTLRCLLDADDLTLLSIWSPTFISALMSELPALADRLVDDIARGGAQAPNGTQLARSFLPRPERALQVRTALQGMTPDTRALWPRLELISCWTHGSAARFVPQLRCEFPHAEIQGKGLLATEGVVSIPLTGEEAPVLAVNSGFFEFLDAAGHSYLAHELDEASTYRVLLTTHGGLYRYDIGDRVRVRGHLHTAPLLEFVGRGDRVSDICGEKLSEIQVQHCLAGHAGFAALAPHLDGRQGYHLLLDAAEHDAVSADAMARAVDNGLRENPHYDLARRLGQLAPVTAQRHADALWRYLSGMNRQGQRFGDIKPPALCCDTGWQRIFEGS